MAYGMLTSFALGAAQGLGTAMINKYSKDQDAEIKAKADAEREARIEEAAIRSEGRAKVRADTDYARLRTDTLTDKESQAAQDYINKATEHEYRVEDFNTQERLRQQDELNKEKREALRRNDPNDIDYKLKNQQLESSKAAELNSDTLRKTQEINQKVAQLDLSNKQEIADIRNQLKDETDETKAGALQSRLLTLEGKSNKPTFETIAVPSGKVNPVTKEPIKENVLVQINPVTSEWKLVDIAKRLQSNQPFTKEEAIAIAKAEADADPKIGVRTSNWFTEDNATKYDNYVNSRVVELTNTPKGMLNSKSEGKTSDKVAAPKSDDLNSLYSDKVNIGGMRKPNSQEFEPSQGVAKDLHKMDHQLWLYGTGESKNVDKPVTTLREAISTWSPKKDNNDTERLISDASKLLNIKPDDKIDLTDSATRGQLMKALVKQEHGGQIKGDINKIYQYIDDTYGSAPLTPASNPSKKIISITKEK